MSYTCRGFMPAAASSLQPGRGARRVHFHIVVDDLLEAALERDNARRISEDDRPRRHRAHEHRTRADEHIVADGDLAEQDGVRADVHAIADGRRAARLAFSGSLDRHAVRDGAVIADPYAVGK